MQVLLRKRPACGTEGHRSEAIRRCKPDPVAVVALTLQKVRERAHSRDAPNFAKLLCSRRCRESVVASVALPLFGAARSDDEPVVVATPIATVFEHTPSAARLSSESP